MTGDHHQDARILRDRQQAARDDFDLALSRAGALAARRILLQVYNGGAMPSQPGYYFLGHPVDLGGDETVGTAPTTAVDTSAGVPFTIFNHAPQVGDLVVATAVGKRWVAERGGSGPCTICVTACYPAVPVYGVTITIKDGTGAVVGSCTTGASGCCSFPFIGTYTVQVTANGTLTYSASRTLTPNGSVTIAISGTAGLVCCGGYAIPQSLTLTDGIGSLQFNYYPNYYYPIWYGGHSADLLSCSVTTPNNVCVAAAPSQGPVRVCYQMTCVAGTQPAFSIQRSWSWVYEQGTLIAIWYQDPTGFVAGQPCATSPPAACGNPHTDTSSFSANPSSTSPFTLSGIPAAAAGNATADPVGGSIVISA